MVQNEISLVEIYARYRWNLLSTIMSWTIGIAIIITVYIIGWNHATYSQKSLYYLRKSLVKRLMTRLYTLSNHLSVKVISFITIFDSICSPDAEIREVTCSRYIDIPDRLASSVMNVCMESLQINTILLYYISWTGA